MHVKAINLKEICMNEFVHIIFCRNEQKKIEMIFFLLLEIANIFIDISRFLFLYHLLLSLLEKIS